MRDKNRPSMLPPDSSQPSHPSSLKRGFRSATRLFVPWTLTAFLAISLFTTFTYQPPEIPTDAKTHPHIIQNALQQFTQAANPSTQPRHRPPPPSAIPVKPAAVASGTDTDNDDTTIVDLASLHLPPNATTIFLNQIPPNHPLQNNPILAAARAAAVDRIPLDTWPELPRLAQHLVDLYGPRIVSSSPALHNSIDNHAQKDNEDSVADTGPVVYGMETCAAYRAAVPPQERYVGPAGMFNTGTNALEHHLRANIVNVASVWQIPWGKHRMPYQRLKHVAPGMDKKDQSKCLPVVIVRDPYHWMQSMCKSPYSAHWKHGPHRCPNLALDADDHHRFKDPGWGQSNSTSFRVKVIFNKDNDIEYFDSLAHLWSTWYRLYFNATYPHLIIRFEDMLLQAPAVLDRIAQCVGGQVRDPIQYQRGSAKAHGSHTDFFKAILKSADAEKRGHLLQPRDVDYATAHLDQGLMEAFEYKMTV